ncbi:MAG: tetratricopeptide repeat-containing sensor histidine kinase [Mucilaginibacter sp.]|jgi:signal transduction histidine kinase|uniref:ATP-binding protein n=1 Tax=Mucilaginibacter sp. TaxID=1882438 RepID=UPI0035687FE7
MKKALPLLLLFVFSTLFCSAQSTELTGIKGSLPHIRDSFRYVDALNRIAMLMYEQNIDSTFYYTRQARAMADHFDYPKGKADALNNLGVFFDIKGNLQLALRYYNEAYAVYRRLKDSANSVQSLMNIAMVYKELGKDGRSIQRFNESLSLGKKLQHDSIMSLAIYNYLLSYPARFNRDARHDYIGKAREIAMKYHDQRSLVAIDQLVADDMIAHGNRQEGLILLDHAIDTAITNKLYYVSMDMLIDMGDQLAENQPARAAAYYRRGLAIAGQNGYLIYSQLIARKLFNFYTDRRDTLTASVYSRRLINLHDEQEKLNNASGIDYLDYALKDEQIKSLTTRSKYQTALLIISVLSCLLAIAVIVVIRQHLKRTRRLNEQVTSQNSQMKRTLGALEQSQADNTRMMQIVAHDLRNPIGAMYSMAALMLEEPGRPEEDLMMLQMIKTSGKNSLELVSDLLQVQFRTEELQKEPIDIAEMLQYCVSLLLNKAKDKEQHIKLETIPVVLPASREKLWRVISNLVGNAIKFSPTGASIVVKMDRGPQNVRISVKDEGIGIPPEMQEKIFDLFTEAKRPGTAGEQSFGLGLAISRQIVEAHGGKIWFESIPDTGTTFFVDLPIET